MESYSNNSVMLNKFLLEIKKYAERQVSAAPLFTTIMGISMTSWMRSEENIRIISEM